MLINHNFFINLQNMNILKFNPIEKEKVWGSETWVVSAVPGSESVLSDGKTTIPYLMKQYGSRFIGMKNWSRFGMEFPLLIKFIQANQDLSIQVHPNDELARARHGCMGKTEMWFVMDSEPGAKLYSGFKSPISKYEYEKRIADGTITEVLQEHKVKPGDVFFIPAGRVHAICGGIRLAEIQQTSDITYRIYDYNRPGLDGKPRELHTELAKDAIDYTVYPSYKTEYQPKENDTVTIVNCPYFTVKTLDITRPYHRNLVKYDSFVIYICLKGTCTIRPHQTLLSKANDGHVTICKGESCIVPMECADIDLVPESESGRTEVLEVYIDNKNF